jgi:hypothetical protein
MDPDTPPPGAPDYLQAVGISTAMRQYYHLGMIPPTAARPGLANPPGTSTHGIMKHRHPALYDEQYALRGLLLDLRRQHNAAAAAMSAAVMTAADAAAFGAYREHVKQAIIALQSMGHPNPLFAYHVDSSIKLHRHYCAINADNYRLCKGGTIDEEEYRRRLGNHWIAADYYQPLPQ